jgi:hypothetical protein
MKQFQGRLTELSTLKAPLTALCPRSFFQTFIKESMLPL